MIKDPVCGMELEKEKVKGSYDYHGFTYYFCSENCLDMFKAIPRGYVGDHPERRNK
jgi:Cu+-exporting ATPase